MNSFAISCIVLLLLLNGASRVAESRAVAGGDVSSQRRHGHHHDHDIDSPPADHDAKPKTKLLVFGDDFADTGNGDSDPKAGYGSRSWRSPFGMSDTAHGRQPSGRFSDGLVQPDFLAKIMGRGESPPPFTYDDDWDDGIHDAGLNFAVGGCVALDRPLGLPTLRDQVQQLRELIRDDGVVEREDLRDSVALLAYSGNDYAYAKDDYVNSVVRDQVEPKQESTLYGRQFKERLRPCCEAANDDAGDYCGLDGRYSLCDHPEGYFFWDDQHLTHAGWRAVMQLLQGPIMAFLGISNLEHL